MAKDKKNNSSRAGKKHDRNRSFASRTPILGYYLIVTDTDETERNYFEGLRDSIPTEIRDRIVIHVEKAKTTYDLIDRTLELCGSQAQQRIPWIVFDRDEVKDFDGMIQSALQSGINVGWSNPCFEIWMHAYFGKMPNLPESTVCCSHFSNIFEKHTGRKYKKNDPDIYEKLDKYGNLEKAPKFAEQRIAQAESDGLKPSESCPACTVHLMWL